MPELTAAQVKAEAGYAPLTARVQFRASEGFKERIETAADECGMAAAEWCRTVVEMAVEAHEHREAAILAGIDPDTLDLAGHADVDVDDLVDEVAPDDEYARPVQAGAQVIREVETGDEAAPPLRVSPRDCPHLPIHRSGRVCGSCGLTIGRAMMSTAGGRYTGGR